MVCPENDRTIRETNSGTCFQSRFFWLNPSLYSSEIQTQTQRQDFRSQQVSDISVAICTEGHSKLIRWFICICLSDNKTGTNVFSAQDGRNHWTEHGCAMKTWNSTRMKNHRTCRESGDHTCVVHLNLPKWKLFTWCAIVRSSAIVPWRVRIWSPDLSGNRAGNLTKKLCLLSNAGLQCSEMLFSDVWHFCRVQRLVYWRSIIQVPVFLILVVLADFCLQRSNLPARNEQKQVCSD